MEYLSKLLKIVMPSLMVIITLNWVKPFFGDVMEPLEMLHQGGVFESLNNPLMSLFQHGFNFLVFCIVLQFICRLSYFLMVEPVGSINTPLEYDDIEKDQQMESKKALQATLKNQINQRIVIKK